MEYSHEDAYNELYKLTKQNAKSIVEAEVPTFFSDLDDSNSRVKVFCPHEEYVSAFLKLGWLLGAHIDVVTPHIVLRRHVHDSGYGSNLPDRNEFHIVGDYENWVSSLRQHIETERLSLLPCLYVEAKKDWDSMEEWNDCYYVDVRNNNLNAPISLPSDFLAIKALTKLDLDIPQLIIHDVEILEKVQKDYPIAALEFRRILREAYELGTSDDSMSETRTMERLRDEVVSPGVLRIADEYKEIWKSRAIRTVSELVAVGVPLLYPVVANPGGFLSQLLTAGIGLRAARHLTELRSEVVEIGRRPFFAALKMKL